MSLFPHVWAIPAVFVLGAAIGWFLRSRLDSPDSTPTPRILEDD